LIIRDKILKNFHGLLSNRTNSEKFVEEFKELSSKDYEFRSSIESSTKNIENYQIRYSKFQTLMNESFGLQLKLNPFPIPPENEL
jgi:hypothetical protein